MQFTSFAIAAFAAVVAAQTPIVSPDGSCGVLDTVEYTCEGSGFGSCCGASGVCGDDATSCSLASGCNQLFGICNSASTTVSSSSLSTTSDSTTLPTDVSTTSSSISSQPTIADPTNPFTTISSIGSPTLGAGNSTIPFGPTGTRDLSPTLTATDAPTSAFSGILGAVKTVGAGPAVLAGTAPADAGSMCYIYTRLVTLSIDPSAIAPNFNMNATATGPSAVDPTNTASTDLPLSTVGTALITSDTSAIATATAVGVI